MTKSTGDLVITEPGAVIDGREVFGTITVKAPNVTIKNTRVRAQKPVGTGVVNSTSLGLLIKDSEILSDHVNSDVNGVMGHSFVLDGVQIHRVIDQVHLFGPGNVTIKNSWLHDNFHFEKDPNWNHTPSHDDNIQVVGGSNIRVLDSVLEDSHNAAIMLAQDSSRVSNVEIAGNTIGGGACSINLAPKSRGEMTAVKIAQNRFQKGTQRLANCAVIAPAANAPALEANVWAGTTEPVRLSRG